MQSIIERIGQIVTSKGISMRSFEKSLGVSNGAIGGAIKKGTDVGSSMVSKIIETYPDINPLWLLTGTGPMIGEADNIQPNKTFVLSSDKKVEIQDIPLYDLSATAGLMAIFNDTIANPDDYLRVPNLPPVDGAIYVRGESMTPLLKSGDIIIYKKLALSLDSVLWGQIYLLSFEAGGDFFTVIKYLQKADRPDYIRLVSQNSQYEPKDIPLSSIRALAIVKASITFHTIE